MKLLVAICTYNRAALLRETLTSLSTMDAPSQSAWSVLIMNNNCSDDTDRVISDFAGRLPVSRAFEPVQGLSYARNAVVASEAAASADYIVWTDDDVRVDTGWLHEYERAFVRFPDHVIFGGNVVPWFEVDPPWWIVEGLESFSGAFSLREFPDGMPLDATGPHIPYGANFAIRAVEQRRLRYDTKLGVSGRQWRGGEEVDLMRRLLQAGSPGRWVAAASVRHYVPRQRMSRKFLGAYFRGQGRTRSIQMGEDQLPWYGKPRDLWTTVAREWMAYAVARVRGDAKVWARRYQTANLATGRLLG